MGIGFSRLKKLHKSKAVEPMMAERVVVTSSKKNNAKSGYTRLSVPFETQRAFVAVATGPEHPPPKATAAPVGDRNGGNKQPPFATPASKTQARHAEAIAEGLIGRPR